MKYLTALLLAGILCGCGTSTLLQSKVSVDPKLLQLCSPLPRYTPDKDLGVAYYETVTQWAICANQQAATVNALKTLTK